MLLFTAMTTSATWADTATFTFGTTGSNPDSGITSSDGNITLTSDKLSTYKNGLVTQSGSTLTIASAEGKNATISKVEITCDKTKDCFSCRCRYCKCTSFGKFYVCTIRRRISSTECTYSYNFTTICCCLCRCSIICKVKSHIRRPCGRCCHGGK